MAHADIAPVFDTAREDYSDKAVFIKVDVDKHPDLSDHFSVRYLPSIFAINPEDKEVLSLPAHKMVNVQSFEGILDKAFEVFAKKSD